MKENIILTLKNVENINFDFEQNINGKIEKGNCTIEYPKKIYCKYNLGNQKILVSDGKTLIVKTNASYFKYSLNKTPLKTSSNLIFMKKCSIYDQIGYIDINNVKLVKTPPNSCKLYKNSSLPTNTDKFKFVYNNVDLCNIKFLNKEKL